MGPLTSRSGPTLTTLDYERYGHSVCDLSMRPSISPYGRGCCLEIICGSIFGPSRAGVESRSMDQNPYLITLSYALADTASRFVTVSMMPISFVYPFALNNDLHDSLQGRGIIPSYKNKRHALSHRLESNHDCKRFKTPKKKQRA